MHEFINEFIKYGYILLFLYSLGGGMIALLAVGVFASTYNINPFISIAVAFVGNFIGSSGIFYLTRVNKKEFKKYLKKYRRKIALLVILFRKNGFIFTLVCKYIYGLKTLGPIAAEISKLSFLKFEIFNIISCLIWSVTVFYFAYFIGEQLDSIFQKYKSFAPFFLILIIILIFIYFKVSANEKK